MLVVKAAAMGMCFGVKRALKQAHALNNPENTTILGEIVHNQKVQQELLQRGFSSQDERRRQNLPNTPGVLVTAHGISQAYRQRLQGKQVIDTTCPLVTRLHTLAGHYRQQGYRLLLVGQPEHVEVLGITEDYSDTVVIATKDKVSAGLGPRLAVMAQTTTPADLFEVIYQKVVRLHPGSEVIQVNTICRPTKERQMAIKSLLEKVEALVVVGGSHSNNTLRLCEQARKLGIPNIRVEGPDELPAEWFKSFKIVGLSAGTSTPDKAINAVYKRLLEIDRTLKSRAC